MQESTWNEWYTWVQLIKVTKSLNSCPSLFMSWEYFSAATTDGAQARTCTDTHSLPKLLWRPSPSWSTLALRRKDISLCHSVLCCLHTYLYAVSCTNNKNYSVMIDHSYLVNAVYPLLKFWHSVSIAFIFLVLAFSFSVSRTEHFVMDCSGPLHPYTDQPQYYNHWQVKSVTLMISNQWL